ncbi:MAG: aminomethyl-transferring glycine dehydrogenase subunit GcvPB, partial [Eubacteriales bacterium]|nr:aminomethyl-transferring glycine dehydrogenase subunit GcvPB [Eubacteriales bacterium]MDD4584079.1 aminomethyl-transferring glycine dehydrogenase subunit GcvPB [Eubacteriales bacterium]
MNRVKLRKYHSAAWDEPIILTRGTKGERGIIPPQPDPEITKYVGTAETILPSNIKRKTDIGLPEISQYHVLQHYLRLSQQTMGMDLGMDIGEGTCTMKYSPKVHEQLAKRIAEIHPLEPDAHLQGILEIAYKLEQFLKEISGMEKFSFQPGGGAHATYTNACLLRKYHEERGELAQRDEVITTIFSHPCDAATPSTAGFKVITLMPDENGYPDLDALKSIVSERTAGIMFTNPEDTGIFNPRVAEYVKTVHDAGGLCFYDQANANGILGVARAFDAGFDACHFNLHKTFSTPHGSEGPASGAYGVRKELAKYLPSPTVEFDGENYYFDYDRPDSIGKVRDFFGNLECIVKAYAWIMSMGAEGLKMVSAISVLNNNYLDKLLLEIKGVSRPYAEGKRRMEQARYSLGKLQEDTGVGTEAVRYRLSDYGVQGYWMSHHPWIIPEPFTPEPCETYSKEDIEYWVAALRQVVEEAY